MQAKCGSCGKTFGGLTGFDAHRVGKHTSTGPHYGRRCLSDDELSSKGYRNIKGLWRSERGDFHWRDNADTQGA
jgi:hypothetical protein